MARRLAAIMFTDVVGSTQLAQRNEPAALELLRQQAELAQPVLAAHHGRLVKSTGDGMLVEFQNALEAVQCAVELQRRIHERGLRNEKPELQMRIGIHVGDVEETGTDILGDTVNVAARMEPLATPGGICFSSVVYAHIRNKTPYAFDRLGPRALKGVLEPVEIYRVALPWERPAALSGDPGPRRLAVLPLANLSSDPENEYFADGMTEELISTISKVPRLDVISRTSVMRFKGTGTSMEEIARQLNAGWILEGSVRKAGQRVRTTVQLIEATADRHLWSERYDRGLEDVFEVQSEIAQRVADELRILLTEDTREEMRKVPTQDTEAHLFYLKGRALEAQSSVEGCAAAIREYERAVAQDPRYAMAHVGLANCYFWLGYWEGVPAEESARKVEAAARRAIEIDPGLAEAHLAMAEAVMSRPGAPPAEVRSEIMRAIQLNPSLPAAHLHLAMLTRAAGGDPEEARASAERALELDPLSTTVMEVAATCFLYVGKIERAARLFEETLRLDPTLALARTNLGICHVLRGRFDEGIAEIRKSIQMDRGFSATARADLVLALVRAGRADEATEVINELLEHRKTHRTGAVALGLAYARLGDLDRAFEWLETAREEHSTYLAELPGELDLENLRKDPRYPRFLERLKAT